MVCRARLRDAPAGNRARTVGGEAKANTITRGQNADNAPGQK